MDDDQRAQQVDVVRAFAPHLSDDQLMQQERAYLCIGLLRVSFVGVLPALALTLIHTNAWFLRAPVFLTAIIISTSSLGMTLHRYFVLWPEGQHARVSYWEALHQAPNCHRLKVLGHYHRKIDRLLARFNGSTSDQDIVRRYRLHDGCLFLLFATLYGASIALLFQPLFQPPFLPRRQDQPPLTLPPESTTRQVVLYALSVGTGLVVFRYLKVHLIELPQALRLRQCSEFSVDLFSSERESVPFARPVPAYAAIDEHRAAQLEEDPIK